MDDDVAAIGKVLLKLDDILDNVLNDGPVVVAPVIDDGLNDCGMLYGLRECVGGSGLNATFGESEPKEKRFM